MARQVIEITQRLIDLGVQRDSRHCMFAEAIKESNPNYHNVIVDLQTIRWTNKRTKKRYIAFTPTKIAQALVDFDQGDTIEPFSLQLRATQIIPVARPKRDESGEPTRKPSGQPQFDESTGRKRLRSDGVVLGGTAPPHAHLGGSSSSGRSKVKPPPPDASNIELSKAAYRQYGRRLLKR